MNSCYDCLYYGIVAERQSSPFAPPDTDSCRPSNILPWCHVISGDFHSQCRVFLLVIWWILWLVFFSWMKERDLKGRLRDVFGLYIYFGWMIVEIDQLWLDMDRKDLEICSTLSFQDIFQDIVLTPSGIAQIWCLFQLGIHACPQCTRKPSEAAKGSVG